MNQHLKEIEMLQRVVRNQEQSLHARQMTLARIELALNFDGKVEEVLAEVRKASDSFQKPAWEVQAEAEQDRR